MKDKKYTKVLFKNSEIKYEAELHTLQIELLKLQDHVKANGLKVVVLFEGRDASSKGGCIKRVTEHLNPRGCKVVALEKPTEVESTQWYFQRYIQHLPSAGQIVLFDRSWYNRSMVEPVMRFCSEEEYSQFLNDVPQFEKMLVASGILLIKFYFSVSKEVQNERFESRKLDHLKQYKISPVDLKAQGLWDEYTEAKRIMLSLTDTLFAPWTIIKSDNKRKARVNSIKHILRSVDYPDRVEVKISNKILFTGTEELNNMK